MRLKTDKAKWMSMNKSNTIYCVRILLSQYLEYSCPLDRLVINGNSDFVYQHQNLLNPSNLIITTYNLRENLVYDYECTFWIL